MSRPGSPNAGSEIRHRRQFGEKGTELNFHGLGDGGVGYHDAFPFIAEQTHFFFLTL